MSNVPKLRFKEFSGEWEEKKLENYGTLINGLTYSPDNIVENGLLVLRSYNIQNQQISFHDNVYVDLDIKEEYLTKENDILATCWLYFFSSRFWYPIYQKYISRSS